MSYGDFHLPLPINEPVLSYTAGSPEKKRLKEVLAELKSTQVDVPMYIGEREVRTGNTGEIRPPHETAHLLGVYHHGEEQHVHEAIDAALAAPLDLFFAGIACIFHFFPFAHLLFVQPAFEHGHCFLPVFSLCTRLLAFYDYARRLMR